MRKFLVIAVAAQMIFLMVLHACANEYRIIDLGTLDGLYGRGMGISESGQVAGYTVLSESPYPTRAAIWNDENSGINLETLGGLTSRAHSINDFGNAGGYSSLSTGQNRGFFYDGSTMNELPTLGGDNSAAWDINNDDLIVGQADKEDKTYHACLWDAGGTIDLGAGNYSIAYGINSWAQIVGSASNGSGSRTGFVWEDEVLAFIDPYPGGTWAEAQDINDSGQIVLWGDIPGGDARAIIYDHGAYTALGTLGGEESWAYGMNNKGDVVGSADLEPGYYHAFVYNGDEIIDLGTLGGTYSVAYDINDIGQITGRAQAEDGSTHAVIWMPIPEPSMYALIISGVIWVAFSRRLGHQIHE
jgi:probable HAF family extracellular repeat protein